MWITFAIISALFSAAAAITEKKTLFKENALVFSMVLAFFNLILSLPFFFFIDFSLISNSALIALFIKSILGALSFLLVMNGLKKLEISSSLPLLVLTPGITAVFAYFILNEKLAGLEIFGMLMLMLGTYFLQLKSKQRFMDPFLFSKQNKAYLYILGAVLIFTITSILDKTILGKYKMAPQAFLPIQHLFFAVNFSLFFVFSKQSKKAIYSTVQGSWKLILLVAIFTIIYRYSHILAIKAGSVALVLSIKRTSVFFATVIGGHYFNEQNLVRKSIATLLMIAGAIFIIIG